jgi:hypothetical protein
MSDKVKYPEVKKVKLVGEDGNAFAIVARVKKAMKVAGVPNEAIAEFVNDAFAGDYNNLLRVVMANVKVK